MHKPVRASAYVTLFVVAGVLFSFSAHAQQVPQQLQPPANEQLLLQVHAKGDQIYFCKVGRGCSNPPPGNGVLSTLRAFNIKH